MVIRLIIGAVGFLTRVPLGRSERAWTALATRPAAMVPVAYLVGAVGALSVVALPGPTAAIAYPATIIGFTGIAHLDGLGDLGDASVIHGSPAERRTVMQDTVTGVGGTVSIGLALIGLAVASLALASAPALAAVGIVLAAEVGAKLAMVGLAVCGKPAHEGMGSTLLRASPTQLLVGATVAAPVSFLAWPALAPLFAFMGAIIGGALVAAFASRLLGGVSGDVFGATNEVARLVGLHVGVVAWMHC